MDEVLGWLKENVGGLFETFGLIKVYIACAVAGGTVLLGQAGLNLFGLGGDTDVDADVDADELDTGDGSVSFISVRTLASFATMFGLVGWLGTANEWGTWQTPLYALLAGSSTMLAVAYLMFTFRKLASSGNVRPIDAVGSTAQVYLRIPGQRSGQGKVTVTLQGRSQEFSAVTPGDAIPTGAACRLTGMTTEDTFEVEPLN
jgi:hypothetical protein